MAITAGSKPTKPHNYLNNKAILKEIHKSKVTYCSYALGAAKDYDMIVGDVSEILPNLEVARQERASRLAKLVQDEALEKDGVKLKNDEVAIDPDTIPTADIVFRVMTWEHIPIAPPKVLKTAKKGKTPIIDDDLLEDDEDIGVEPPKTAVKYVKVNFPPFFHYMIDDDGQPKLVAKSHWVGGMKTGHFSKDHGTMTDKLARMFMKLVERYATRWNWRGYSYNDEMRSQALLQLSQIGLQFDESKSANPFAYYTTAITNSFTRVFNLEKTNQNIRDTIMEMNDLNPSYTRQNEYNNDGGDE